MTLDWQYPLVLAGLLPALLLLYWFDARGLQPLAEGRKRLLFLVRAVSVVILFLALASPAYVGQSNRQSVVFLVDESASQGAEGTRAAWEEAKRLAVELPSDVATGWVTFSSESRVIRPPQTGGAPLLPGPLEAVAAETDMEQAIRLARGLFPAGSGRNLVVITDGLETRGDVMSAARDAQVEGVRIFPVAQAGVRKPDARVTSLTPTQGMINEGATVDLRAEMESTIGGETTLRLYENGVEVEKRTMALQPGEIMTEVFRRTPSRRNLYNYRLVMDKPDGDTLPGNNEALAVVDVRGRPLLLYLEGEEKEAGYLVNAMEKEGIQLEVRPAAGMPRQLRELTGYDGIILSDVPAHQLGDDGMILLRDYVDKLGGGLIMIGGVNSFGVGGYHRTPLEEILPVTLKAPDEEEQYSSALALILDRSGSMSGEKMEICKSASVATAEILSRKDFIGVYAFDSEAHVVVPMTRVTSLPTITSRIAALAAGGGTNAFPAMSMARQDLVKAEVKVRHMIVLTDGQTAGEGYEALAAQCRSDGITISTVAIGGGAHVALLQSIASTGGGRFYSTNDLTAITRIFTQDTMLHTGRMIREEAFVPALVEKHPMVKGWEDFQAPPLLGYVKTMRRATAQVPLVTDTGDPLLAHGRFGLGKVTAFTSDCKSRWAALWVGRWAGYGKLWAQIIRETARPPQGRNMELQCQRSGTTVDCLVDLWQDAGNRLHDATVTAEVFHVTASGGGEMAKPWKELGLPQTAPGRYAASFVMEEPGVYLVRARSGSRLVSTGLVFQEGSEVAGGQVNEALLRDLANLTGGTLLAPGSGRLVLGAASSPRLVELWPWFTAVAMGLFLLDIVVRRWENVQGIGEFFVRLAKRRGKAGQVP